MLSAKALYRVVNRFVPDFIEKYKEDYSTRLKVQKYIYLFEKIYGKCSYNYSWYLAGPYSSILTQQIYDSILETPREVYEEWQKMNISESAEIIFNKIDNVVNTAHHINEEKTSKAELLELVASIWYIADKDKGDKENKCVRIKEKLLISKPQFTTTYNLDEIIQFIIGEIDRQ